VGYIITTLLQTVWKMYQWKNFENRSIIDEDMNKSKVPRFYKPPCIMRWWWTRSNSDLSATEYVTDVSRCLDMYAVYKSLFPLTMHFVWQSTPVGVFDLTTDWTGSVRTAVLDIRGSASWRSTLGLLQLPPGTWPVIVKSGGRNDPSPVKQSNEWV